MDCAFIGKYFEHLNNSVSSYFSSTRCLRPSMLTSDSLYSFYLVQQPSDTISISSNFTFVTSEAALTIAQTRTSSGPSSISRPPAQSTSTSTISASITSPAANLTASTRTPTANSTVTSQNGITGPAIAGIVIGAITAIALIAIATLLLLRYRKTSASSNKPEVAAFPVVSELRSGEHANRHEAQGKELGAERFEMDGVLVESRQVRHEMPT
jgi:hypothetical protein